MANANSLASVNHFVVLMLENRSFDHMLGYLYPGKQTPSGQPFEGLAGTESNLASDGQPVTVFRIEPSTPNAYLMPGADPGEGYMATNDQLYGSDNGPASSGQAATCQGFVANYAYTLGWESKETSSWPIETGTVEGDIMGCFTPEALPVLSALAKGYAGGTDLSGGQWQRVALARALASVRLGAGLVLLDEPTAQLDVRGEMEIFERILAATRQCTTILISHRFSTVRHADRIAVVEDGQVAELGSHDELMQLHGRYWRMFSLQAQRFAAGTPEEGEEEVTFDVLS